MRFIVQSCYVLRAFIVHAGNFILIQQQDPRRTVFHGNLCLINQQAIYKPPITDQTQTSLSLQLFRSRLAMLQHPDKHTNTGQQRRHERCPLPGLRQKMHECKESPGDSRESITQLQMAENAPKAGIFAEKESGTETGNREPVWSSLLFGAAETVVEGMLVSDWHTGDPLPVCQLLQRRLFWRAAANSSPAFHTMVDGCVRACHPSAMPKRTNSALPEKSQSAW